MKNKSIKHILASLIVFVICTLLSLIGVIDRFDFYITDALYQRPVSIDNRIKIIAIDEKSLNELGAFSTWDRNMYASLLDKLYEDSDYSPQLVAFDMIFQGETDSTADKAFAEAAKKAGGIVCGANIVYDERIETDKDGKLYVNTAFTQMVEYPYDELYKYAKAGFADTIQDKRDGRVREFYPILSVGDTYLPSFAYAIAGELNSRDKMDINIPRVHTGDKYIIRYSAKPEGFEALSFVDVLNGDIPKEALKDSILLVGAYAPGMMDSYNVPNSNKNQMYGVEIHANILHSIEKGMYMEPASKIKYSLIYGLIAFIFALFAQILPFFISPIIGIIIIIAQMIIGYNMSINHVFIPLLTLPVSIIIIEIVTLGYRYFASLAQRRKVLKAFRQYVAPQIVEEISKKGNYELTLGGRRRDIAVLFVDIRGFTPLSESLSPEQVVEVLNEYLALTTKAIFDNMGTLDKFVGDATMAVFNSPFDLDDYVYRAVCAARDIVKGSKDIEQKALKISGKEVGFGVGVHCGPAVVGNIGCDFRMDYTAIGDTVNTAARLESNANAGQVLLSQAVVDALGDRIKTNAIGEIPLKGKSVPLMVYELIQ